MQLTGRKPALTPEQRAYCHAMRLRRQDGLVAPTTDELAARFKVSPATIRNSARNLHAKHHEFIRRLVRLSQRLREPVR
jgi:hypothetical protein